MPGLDLGHVSSNWKKLQAQLGSDKSSDATTKSLTLKRKASLSRSENASRKASKTTYGSKSSHDTTRRRVKMGLGLSKHEVATDSPPNDTAAQRARLLKEHDLAPEDLSAAYGTASDVPTSREFEDVINGGIHPTHKIGQYVALDCEMVGMGEPPSYDDNVLARASLVNYNGEQIYDSYVQAPPGMIVQDYRTHVSGITPAHMRKGYARTFQQVKSDVAKILEGRVLVGHALKNDLSVLVLKHPLPDIRDTSKYAKYRITSRGRAPALRKLAKEELNMDIQSGEHSSVEDARTTMLLFRKEKQGFEEEHQKTFGAKNKPGMRNALQRTDLSKPTSKLSDTRGSRLDDDDDMLSRLSRKVDEEEDSEDEDDGAHTDQPAGGRVVAVKSKKKKKKTKKRTKRN